MRPIFLVVLLFAFLQLSFGTESQAPAESANSKVIVLQDDNFDEIAPSTKYLLIEFYAPWCGHCQRLSPEYEKAAEALSDLEDVKLAKVDVTEQRVLAEKFNIRSLPTLFFLKNGDISMYSGGRTASDIEKWVRKNSAPLKIISSEDEYNSLRAEKRSSSLVIATFASLKDSEEISEFESITNNPLFGDLDFAIKIYPSVESFTVTVISPSAQELEFPQEEPSLENWLLNNAFPVVGGMEEADIRRYESKKFPLSVLFYDPSNQEQTQAVVSIFEQAAKSLRQVGSFAATDGLPGIASFRNLGYHGELPVIASSGFNKRGAYFFSIFPTTSVEEVSTWISDVLEGRLKPNMMSQPIPETPSQPGEVTVVVGKTFEELVLDPTKDVLLEIYSPNCGHCKNLEPVYAQLAKSFENNEKIRIAKIDGTTNDVDYEITGFPTILLYPANDKKPIAYLKHSRTFEELKEFALSQSSSGEEKDEL